MAYIGTGTLSPLIAYSQNVHNNSSNEGFYEDSQEIFPRLTNQQFSVLFVACR